MAIGIFNSINPHVFKASLRCDLFRIAAPIMTKKIIQLTIIVKITNSKAKPKGINDSPKYK